MFDRGVENVFDRLFDSQIVNLVTVVGQNDIDKVLSNVVNVALDGGQDDLALFRAFDLVHERFEIGDRGFHHLGGLQHER